MFVSVLEQDIYSNALVSSPKCAYQSTLYYAIPLLSPQFQIHVEDFPLCDIFISNIDSPDSVIDRTQTY